jgi:hypothetical protein
MRKALGVVLLGLCVGGCAVEERSNERSNEDVGSAAARASTDEYTTPSLVTFGSSSNDFIATWVDVDAPPPAPQPPPPVAPPPRPVGNGNAAVALYGYDP